jgi:hypothetical protein
MSAALAWERFREILYISQVRPGIREQKLAFTRSFMLLMGMSFENLIKGVHIAKTPNLSIEDRISKPVLRLALHASVVALLTSWQNSLRQF